MKTTYKDLAILWLSFFGIIAFGLAMQIIWLNWILFIAWMVYLVYLIDKDKN